MSTILGMQDVIDYMDKQYEENKKLKEEKDKYFKYLKDKDEECEEQRESANIFREKYTKLKEVNEEIKSWNKEKRETLKKN